MKKNFKLVTFILVILCFPLSSYSQEPIKIGFMDNFPPYNFRGKAGKYIGIDLSIITTTLAELKINVIHMPRSWKRAVYEFQNGTTDILCQLTLTPERRDKWNMVGPIRNNNRAYFVKIDSKINDVKSLNDLKGLRVGIIMGYTYDVNFLNANFFIKDSVINIKQNVLKLVYDRVDIVVENVIPFKYFVKQMGFENKVRMLPTLSSQSYRYIAFQKNKKGNELSKKFQHKLDELKSNGMIQSIIDNWHE